MKFPRLPSREQQLTFVLLASLFVNGVLARKVYTNSLQPRGVVGLNVGDKVPPLTGKDLTGKDVTIDPAAAARTVFYVFAPACGWCERNIANMKTVAEAAKQQGMVFVAVSVVDDDVRTYATNKSLTMPVLTVSPDSKAVYRLGSTPQTLVVDATGRIERNWRGAYTAGQATDIAEYFKTKLPGLAELATKPNAQ